MATEHNRIRRTPDQLLHDRERISEMMLQNMTAREISEALAEERDYKLARRTVAIDISQIRKEWLAAARSNYDQLVVEELQRIDLLEKELWRAMRNSVDTPRKREVFESTKSIIKDDGTIDEDDVRKVVTTLENESINPSFFAQILKCQQERRKLLGLYAPQQIGIHKEVVVKGYAKVSPEDWDVIEGEVIRE